MPSKEKDSSLNEDQENIETKNINLNNNEKKETGINKSQCDIHKLQIDELKERLEKEEKNSAIAMDKWKRALADYQNLEKQIVDKINARENKIILDFLPVYEDLIRARSALQLDGIDSIIKNMKTILEHYEVKPIEAEGKKLDPKLHEVVEEIEEDNLEEGTIVKEIAKGYIIRGKVLKYSKVCVSKKLIKK